MIATAARPLRVGIIGAGNIAQNHARGYQAAGCEIVALADRERAVAVFRAVTGELPKVTP